MDASEHNSTLPNQFRFELDEDEVVVSGVFVSVGLTGDGHRTLRVRQVGEMMEWDAIGMLQCALDRERKKLEEKWS